MKQVVSIALDENTVLRLKERFGKGGFRNKSHLVEEAILEFIENKK